MCNRYNDILIALSKIVGEDLFSKHQSLEYPYPLYRSMAYKILRNEGNSITAIERMSGKHHSTVLNGLRTLDSVLSSPLKREYWICDTYHTLLSELGSPKLVKIVSERDIIELAVSDTEFEVIKSIISKICTKLEKR